MVKIKVFCNFNGKKLAKETTKYLFHTKKSIINLQLYFSLKGHQLFFE